MFSQTEHALKRIALDWNSVAIQESVNPLGQTMRSMFSHDEHAPISAPSPLARRQCEPFSRSLPA
ncbi:MAG: hypothetical protein ACREFP_08025, partial [Acetobacteraceae bacterium]